MTVRSRDSQTRLGTIMSKDGALKRAISASNSSVIICHDVWLMLHDVAGFVSLWFICAFYHRSSKSRHLHLFRKDATIKVATPFSQGNDELSTPKWSTKIQKSKETFLFYNLLHCDHTFFHEKLWQPHVDGTHTRFPEHGTLKISTCWGGKEWNSAGTRETSYSVLRLGLGLFNRLDHLRLHHLRLHHGKRLLYVSRLRHTNLCWCRSCSRYPLRCKLFCFHRHDYDEVIA